MYQDAVSIFPQQSYQCEIWCCRFSPNNDKIVSASPDKTVKVWNVNNGECEMTLTKHSKEVRIILC